MKIPAATATTTIDKRKYLDNLLSSFKQTKIPMKSSCLTIIHKQGQTTQTVTNQHKQGQTNTNRDKPTQTWTKRTQTKTNSGKRDTNKDKVAQNKEKVTQKLRQRYLQKTACICK